MIADREYVDVHAYRIAKHIERMKDAEVLKRIAEISGYNQNQH